MNEFRNAYELSKSEYVKQDDTAKIEALIDAGQFVVYGEYLVHCGFTDAVIDSEKVIIKVCRDHDEATQFHFDHPEAHDEYDGVGTACPQWYVDAQAAINDFDDIPF